MSGRAAPLARSVAAHAPFSHALRSFARRHEPGLLGASALLAVLALWELVWQAGWISPLFFSGPSAVLHRLGQLVADGTLPAHALYSGKNFLAGLALALALGVPLGIVLGWYRRGFLFFDPLLGALYATPRIALYPLLVLWFGLGSGSKIVLVLLSAVLPILINTIAGVRSLDPDLVRTARAFCASDWQIFTTIALPGSVPFILGGVRQAVGQGLIGGIVAELFAGSQGIGFLIAYSGQMFQTDTLLAGVVCVAGTGMLLNAAAARVQRRFERWRPAQLQGGH